MLRGTATRPPPRSQPRGFNGPPRRRLSTRAALSIALASASKSNSMRVSPSTCCMITAGSHAKLLRTMGWHRNVLIMARSRSMTYRAPGRCTLTATFLRRRSKPAGGRRAEWTCAMDAEPSGSSSNSENASARPEPVSESMTASTSESASGGHRSCSFDRCSTNSGGAISGREPSH